MMISTRNRVAVVLLSLCLAFGSSAASAAPSRIAMPAIIPVAPADPGGGWTVGGHGSSNTTTKSGNATGGGAQQNVDGTTNVSMSYVTPNDGASYAGTLTITVYDSSGNAGITITEGTSDIGNGVSSIIGWDQLNVPIGGSFLINLSESNGHGSWFGASFRLTNYQP
jgi:hypothetical protein